MKRFVLIDGNAIVHRAFHAMPGFTMSTGKPVGAVYGFTSMLIRAIQDLKPDYLAVAFDRAEPTFRKQLYVGYQAQREGQMDEALIPQFADVQRVLEAFNVPIFSVAGYEADDVIGTIAARVNGGKSTDYSPPTTVDRSLNAVDSKTVRSQKSVDPVEVIIVSGDRDLLQLVTPYVKEYMPIKGRTDTKLYGEADVQEKYGLKPKQIIDLKALMGDASDNYPGVKGIGPKGAAVLLQKYQTLEGIYEHLADIAERTQLALATDAEQAALAKKLATIITDVPLQFNIEDCCYKIKDVDGAVETLKSFEFKTLPNRLLELVGRPIEEAKKEKSTLKIVKKKEDGQMGLL
jgi:DNA polymerase I